MSSNRPEQPISRRERGRSVGPTGGSTAHVLRGDLNNKGPTHNESCTLWGQNVTQQNKSYRNKDTTSL